MNGLWTVPISSVLSLSPVQAVTISRAILRSECTYSKLSPSALTISDKLMTPDGGIDAEVCVPSGYKVPSDCIFQNGITGFQIKSGSTFQPWVFSSIRNELLSSKGELGSEVIRLIQRHGHYSLVCTGHDLIPKQRNKIKDLISEIFVEKGFEGYQDNINVLGARQVAEFAERYPGVASLLITDPIQEAWTLEEWQHDAHMTNVFEESPEQTNIIAYIKKGLQGETKHIRVLGEAGLGKTRIVLEALKDELISPYVLYIQHGSQFGKTKLFRQILKAGHDKPLVLVVDELPEAELSDIWRHLKSRCGYLKIISMDHGRDETSDEEIDRINAPYLPDDTIKKILSNRIGQSPEIERWVEICEGSPRVALAVADNLCANPSDLLKPPTTIPLWNRFLHGYSYRDEVSQRQVECVAQYMALFSRFGYEAPINEEAEYIAELVRGVDSTIGWARFQEIVHNLRDRRVLQGSQTLFFVPKALHIYLWKQFWVRYGRGFNFAQTLTSMPESLHIWFMKMFKYAGGEDTAHIIDDILRLDGIFSSPGTLISEKGSQFLSVLAEANPAAVLRLLEATVGIWTDEVIFNIKDNRQNLVWTLEKIAVWSKYTVRALQILGRLAVNENANNSNNSTGTLLGLFRIGPEWAATESSPKTRLLALRPLLRSTKETEKLLGLKVVESALDTRGGYRTIGPEYQGLNERAKLWMPDTYSDWWDSYLLYFKALYVETSCWPSALRADVCNTLLKAVEQHLNTPTCKSLAFQVLEELVQDDSMLPERLNDFFWHWREFKDKDDSPEIIKKLQLIERRYTRKDLVSRFNRYVIDVDWSEWDAESRKRRGKPRVRTKILIKALAKRIAIRPSRFNEIIQLVSPENYARGLWYFGVYLAEYDKDCIFLHSLIKITLVNKHYTCLLGYLSVVMKNDVEMYNSILKDFLSSQNSAWLGAAIVLNSDFNDNLFFQCLSALDNRWILPKKFELLRYKNLIMQVPKESLSRLFNILKSHESTESVFVLMELLDSIPFDENMPFNSADIFDVVSSTIPSKERQDTMRGYHWKKVCQKLVIKDKNYITKLLDLILTKMKENYELSYHSDVQIVTNELVKANPSGAWGVIANQFEETLPRWRNDIVNWLKGGLISFDEEEPKGMLVELPYQELFSWIDKDPKSRAALIAHATPNSLDDEHGGKITRELLRKYTQIKGVSGGISSAFHSGGWSGPTSIYLKKKRDKFRRWLGSGYEIEVIRWIEKEIEFLDSDIEKEEIREERSRFD